jgi:hypothetical protein
MKVVGFAKQAKYRCTCRGCAAIVEYTLREVKSKYVNDYGGGGDMQHTITCPNCTRAIYVDKGASF